LKLAKLVDKFSINNVRVTEMKCRSDFSESKIPMSRPRVLHPQQRLLHTRLKRLKGFQGLELLTLVAPVFTNKSNSTKLHFKLELLN
jgi:hypothetical protein